MIAPKTQFNLLLLSLPVELHPHLTKTIKKRKIERKMGLAASALHVPVVAASGLPGRSRSWSWSHREEPAGLRARVASRVGEGRGMYHSAWEVTLLLTLE